MSCLVIHLVSWHKMLSPGWTSSLTSLCSNCFPWIGHIRLCWHVSPEWIFRPMEKTWRISAIFLPIPKIVKTTQKEDFRLFFKTKEQIFCERKLLVPHAHMHHILQWCYTTNGHPSPDRTVFSFLKYFFTPLPVKSYWTCQSPFLALVRIAFAQNQTRPQTEVFYPPSNPTSC